MKKSDLEEELSRLSPAAPSRGLEARIERELEHSLKLVTREKPAKETPGLFLRWFDRVLWCGAGAAAALVVITLLPGMRQSTKPQTVAASPTATAATSQLEPVMASEENLGWKEEGVQFDPQGHPMLKLRRVSVERRAWADLENAGVIQTETPKQEIIWVPVNVQ